MRIVSGGDRVRPVSGGGGVRPASGGGGVRPVSGGGGVRPVSGGDRVRPVSGGGGVRPVSGGGLHSFRSISLIRHTIPNRLHMSLYQAEDIRTRTDRDLTSSYLGVAPRFFSEIFDIDDPVLVSITQRIIGEDIQRQCASVKTTATQDCFLFLLVGLTLDILEASALHVLVEALIESPAWRISIRCH